MAGPDAWGSDDGFGSKFTVPRRAIDGNWLGMHPRVANVYMSLLAQQMATSNKGSPATDETLASARP
jgi:hypothetical protein